VPASQLTISHDYADNSCLLVSITLAWPINQPQRAGNSSTISCQTVDYGDSHKQTIILNLSLENWINCWWDQMKMLLPIVVAVLAISSVAIDSLCSCFFNPIISSSGCCTYDRTQTSSAEDNKARARPEIFDWVACRWLIVVVVLLLSWRATTSACQNSNNFSKLHTRNSTKPNWWLQIRHQERHESALVALTLRPSDQQEEIQFGTRHGVAMTTKSSETWRPVSSSRDHSNNQ